MKYPESWEQEVAGWVDGPDENVDVIITRGKDGPTAHKVKGIDWIATARANWKKLALAVAAAAAVVSVVVLLVKACREE